LTVPSFPGRAGAVTFITELGNGLGYAVAAVHGLILDEMRQFVAGRYGFRCWLETLKRSGHEPTYLYKLDRVYPDQELGLLAVNAAEVTGTPLPELLRTFGEAIVPDMMRVYSYLMQPSWSYAEFLINMEPLLVQAMQLHTPGSNQTRLHVRRAGGGLLEVTYESPLHVCAAVEGVMVAAARESATQATVEQTHCALRGDPVCIFSVKITEPPAAA
jgi:hypothetical protein